MKLVPLTVITAIITVLILVLPIYVKYAVKDEIYNQSITIPKKEFAIVLGASVKKNGKSGSFLKTFALNTTRDNAVRCIFGNAKFSYI